AQPYPACAGARQPRPAVIPPQISSPATLPLNRHPPRNVPSSARRPCTPPPPNPAASPAAYSPGITAPLPSSTRARVSVCSPPRVCRVSTCSRTASSGPSSGGVSGRGGATRIRLSTTYQSEEHTSELQSRFDLVYRLLL